MLIGKITLVMQKLWHELNILTMGTIHIILYMYTKLKIHYQILPNIVSKKTIYVCIHLYLFIQISRQIIFRNQEGIPNLFIWSKANVQYTTALIIQGIKRGKAA